MNAHEEAAGLGVAVLLALHDVAALLDEEARYGVDDARPVVTLQGKDEVVGSRWAFGAGQSR